MRVELPGFAIDRRPYPNDPTLAPLAVTSRAQAEQLCGERGARLCTELEWERACGGSNAASFPTGESIRLDECSRAPAECASGFGVIAMGIERPEWTASDIETRLGPRAVIRGARLDQPTAMHRCAARGEQAAEPTADSGPVQPAFFRCCYGPMPDVAYPAPASHRQFVDVEMTTDQARAALGSTPELAPWADGFRVYGAQEGERAVARGRATRAALAGWELTSGPFRWSPAPGDEALVLSGTNGRDTLIAVLYPRADGGFWHGASFVFANEVVPVAITRTPPSRTELLWTTCQGCPGESGSIRLGDDGVVRIVTR